MNNPVRIAGILACVLLVIVAIVRLTSSQPEQNVKNRVPTLPESTLVAQKAAQDAQTAAAAAQQAQKDIQAQLAELAKDAKDEKKPAQESEGEDNREGRPEATRPGIITDFGEYDLQPTSSTTDFYVGFNFTDRNGFTKRFFPVCPSQTVKTGVPITIMYHWRSWTSDTEGKRGCFQIDGFQAQ